MGETRSRLAASLEVAPEALKPGIRAELDEVEQMDRMSFDMGAASAPMMSKMSRESFHRGTASVAATRGQTATGADDGPTLGRI